MVRINAVLSEDIVAALDSIASEEGKNRSELLREAAENLIGEHRRRREERLRQERLERAVAAQERLRQKCGDWDGVAVVRAARDTR